MYFDYSGSVDLLTSIVAGSLKQKAVFNQSVRCLVILTSLYGSGELLSCQVDSKQWFSLADWINQVTLFKSSRNEQSDQMITSLSLRDFKQITIDEWLFSSVKEKQQWCQDFKDKYQIYETKIASLISPDQYPFNVDRRTLSNDFDRLYHKNWLKRKTVTNIQQQRINKKTQELETINKPIYEYRLVKNWQNLIPDAVKSSLEEKQSSNQAFASDIHKFFDNFAQPINGKQRFFIDVEYVVPSKESDKIEALQEQLKQIWSQNPISPLKLTYRSAKLYQDIEDFIVYPVCFYYLLRAPYLFAYGQFPKGDKQVGWYDFRVDRIEQIKIFDWKINESEIPLKLREQLITNNLPQPEYVKESISEALGYDFYKPQEIMYVRFNNVFHAYYIEGTERDLLFRKVSLEKVKMALKQSDLEPKLKKQLITKVDKYPKDIYCEVPHYVDDNNVVMRLRAWGAKVEVILPTKLRQRIIKDLQDTQKNYQ